MILINLFLAFYLFHPIHISITHAMFNKENQQLELIVRLYRDDLETIINQRFNNDISLTDESITGFEISQADRYIRNSLFFVQDSDTLKLRNTGYFVEDKMLAISYSLEKTKEIEKLEIHNSLMMDLFNDQKNLFILKYEGKRKGYQFTSDNPIQKLIY